MMISRVVSHCKVAVSGIARRVFKEQSGGVKAIVAFVVIGIALLFIFTFRDILIDWGRHLLGDFCDCCKSKPLNDIDVSQYQ